MIDRRTFLIGSGLVALTGTASKAALPVPAGGKLAFEVSRKDTKIGTHELAFSRNDRQLVVRVEVDLLVKLGPVPVYRYSHDVTETWLDDEVASVDATTNDNGTILRVSGERRGKGLSVESTRSGSYMAPAGAIPATHWNRRMIDGPFINTQTGELMRPSVQRKGAERIKTASGATLVAQRFTLTGPVRLETWYDDTPTWSALIFTAEDGSQIEYRKI